MTAAERKVFFLELIVEGGNEDFFLRRVSRRMQFCIIMQIIESERSLINPLRAWLPLLSDVDDDKNSRRTEQSNGKLCLSPRPAAGKNGSRRWLMTVLPVIKRKQEDKIIRSRSQRRKENDEELGFFRWTII